MSADRAQELLPAKRKAVTAAAAISSGPLAAVLQDELTQMREQDETTENEARAKDLRAAIDALS